MWIIIFYYFDIAINLRCVKFFASFMRINFDIDILLFFRLDYLFLVFLKIYCFRLYAKNPEFMDPPWMIHEIKHYFYRRHRLRQKPLAMVAHVSNFPLKYYVIPTNEEPYSSIVHPAVEANIFELKPSLLSMLHQN